MWIITTNSMIGLRGWIRMNNGGWEQMREPVEALSKMLARFALWSLLVSFAYAWRGPGGAVMAIAVAMMASRALRYGLWSVMPGAVRKAYLETLFGAMGRLAKCKGRVTEADVAATRALIDAMRLTPDKRHLAIESFNAGRDKKNHLIQSFKRFRLVAGQQPGVQSDLLNLLIRTILRGRQPTVRERHTLIEIADLLGVSQGVVNECLGAASDGSNSMNVLDAYRILNVHQDAENSQIKQAYRGLMARYHPDKLVSADLSEQERRQAEAKVREIRAAYDELRRLRGFR